MAERLDLQGVLETILGSYNVYFQPPENLKMEYPCIVYQRDYASTKFADNAPYNYMQRYQVTVIDKKPDSKVHLDVSKLPLCTYDRFYTSNNLNHDVLTLFF